VAHFTLVEPTGSRSARGRFVTFEGPEGAGKTTQADLLRAAVEATARDVLLVREPGGTQVGEVIRGMLLDVGAAGAPVSPRVDALLFNAARAQLVEERIRPALERGTTVICGRFADSTLAYQGYGMGLPLDDLRALERFATGGIRPDLTILLDLPVTVGLARKRGEERTRFETAFDVGFHDRVRQGFLALAAAEPERFVTLDATADPADVFGAICLAVTERLGLPVGPDDSSASRPASEPNARHVRITR
jgi:dTMP kinase